MNEEVLECIPHVRGEIVPIMAEVYSESGIEFTVLRSECEVVSTSGNKAETLVVSVEDLEPGKKLLSCSWNTSLVSPGYYLLRFWTDINVSGGDVLDYRIASPQMQRYVKG